MKKRSKHLLQLKINPYHGRKIGVEAGQYRIGNMGYFTRIKFLDSEEIIHAKVWMYDRLWTS